MNCFIIRFIHEEKKYTFSVYRFADKKENIYLIRLTDASLINDCQASLLTLCNSLLKKYVADQSALAPFMAAAWQAIREKEDELNKNWLPWPAWLKRVKRVSALHRFV